MIWEVVSPSAVGINESKLDILQEAIEDGTFKQLQSILIVRSDKLAYIYKIRILRTDTTSVRQVRPSPPLR